MLFVHQKLDRRREVLFYSGDFMTLTIKLTPHLTPSNPHYIQVQNVYNEPEAQNSPIFDQVASILS